MPAVYGYAVSMKGRDVPDRPSPSKGESIAQGVHMKRMAAGVMVALMMMVLPAAAQQPPGAPFDRDRHAAGRDRMPGPSGPPTREASWPGRDGHDGHGRMSREERQQLRRDIDSHGRDIYRRDKGGRR